VVPRRFRAQRPATAVGLIALAASLVLAACSSGDGTKTKPTSSSTTRAPDAQLRRCATPEQAATLLHDGWAANDIGSARQCASDAAVAALRGVPGPDATDVFRGCNPQDGPPVRCGYSYRGGSLTFTVSGSAANGFQVDSVSGIALAVPTR
jgi:hypothetical protein